MHRNKFVATTLQGLEEVLEKEIRELGGENVTKLRRAVSFSGGLSLVYKMNFALRTALRILYNIHSSRLKSEKDFYKHINGIPWEDYIGVNKTFAIKAVVNSPLFNNSHYVALKAKDAIVDRLRDKTGKRPNVSIKDPDFPINVHLNNNFLDISLDSSGEPLFKRGYREDPFEAPLNEVLAAGMILMTGWNGESDLIDPMCGSATIPIEAAMIAKGIPPGVFRKSFAFQNWRDYDEELYRRMVDGQMQSRPFDHKIYASDISVQAVRASRKNIQNALLEDVIQLSKKDFFDTTAPGEEGVLIMNPPYGERIKQERIDSYYEKIGNQLKFSYPGYEAWLLSANLSAVKKIGLRPSVKKELINGNLDCKYLKFELFKGKRSDFLSGEKP